MKNLLLKLTCAVILIIGNSPSFAQGVAFCPSVTAISSASASTAPLCAGSCAVLTASVVPVNATTTYSILSVPYTPFPYTGGTAVSVGTDDVWSPVVNLGFNFCFFGNTYSQCILGSNGQLCFNTALASGYDNYVCSATLPSTSNMPGNTICAPFRDIDPSYGGTMKYYFSGTAPCRALVIYWSGIPMYGMSSYCPSAPTSTFQLVLYENTNFIDVYVANSTACTGWQGGRGIIGIQNAAATVAYCPPGRNNTNFTAINEGWRFMPTGAQSYTVTWSGPAGIMGTGLTQTVCPTSTSSYTATMDVTSCSGVNSTYTSAVTVSISPNPPPAITVNNINQYSCSTATNSADITLSSGTPGYTVSWSPPPASTASTATTYSATSMATGVNTISVIDAIGCSSTKTIMINPPIPISSFSLQAPFGTVIGCVPSTITLNAINTNTVLTNMTYTWTSTSTGTQTGNTIGGQAPSGPNTYTVFGSDMTVGSCITMQTITVTQNLLTPSVNVTPLTATISCNGFPKTFTATCPTPTSNIFGNWYDPTGTPMGSPSGSLIPMTTGNCGIYSVTYTNVVNGCTTTKQVTVTCDPTVPTMSVNALDGFVISCLKPCLKFNISASVGPAPKTYSWTNLSTSVTVVPASGGYTICVPGNYLAEYQDGNACRISQQITVSIDTVRPAPTATTTLAGGSFTLSCFQPSLVATAVTNPMLPAGSYSWTVPPNLTITTPTIAVDQSSVTSTSGTTFTVLATAANGCVGKQKIIFYKDLFVPPYTAVFTPSAITCSNPSVALSPQSTSTSTIPVTFTFTSPPPTTTANASGSLFDIPGTYTMTYQSLLNGCTAITTTVVPLNVVPPATVVLAPVPILCGSNTATINAGTTIQPNYYAYNWKPPVGAGLSCASCYSTSVNTPGNYYASITNTINGCANSNSVAVTSSPTLPVSFTADPTTGFAPLTVGFDNTTILGSATSGTITTSWSYGNGSAYTFTNISSGGTPDGGTTYPAPGSYTVLLLVQQAVGSTTCVGTATTVIVVDIPSELVVPNVFTPNSDGINDLFTVQSTNVSDINCTIFDRWGVKMYDVTSDKGQIGWDGKSLFGKEVPAGTYFYILKATGKDGASYEKKGTVNLYR